MKKNGLNRRGFIQQAGLAFAGLTAGATLLPNIATAGETPLHNPSKKRALRIAHMTDVHVQPEGAAPKGLALALQSVQSLADKPDIIFNGGDSIMDALSKSKSRVQEQWKVWHGIFKEECSLPVVNCIGNHDVWAWSKPVKGAKQDRLYGKQWAIDEFQISNRYYSFDKAGWHFIVLDSTFHHGFGYIAQLGDEQMEWLKADLEKTPATTPVCVLSHIPILSATTFFDGDNEKSGDWKIPGAWMHIDARPIKNLFYQHKNVKVCLSGHIHLQDSLEYLGVKYLCNGAVSGAWWGGNNQEFPPAFAVVDLFEDGSVESQFIPYKWQ
ncbi:MAG: metallophosphoesterase family protein [Chitinophagales bacterium]|nr:metallophosphoesterase family protein [Chitinophagales bacterium]